MPSNERTSRRLASAYSLEDLESLHARLERHGHEASARVVQRALSIRIGDEYRAAVQVAVEAAQ
jgi:hypothetical protein